MVTVEEFANYVGEDYATSSRQADLENSLSVASTLIGSKLEGSWRACPVDVQDQMVKDVAQALYKRSENNGGQYDNPDALRAPNDPLAPVKTILHLYVMGV